MPLTGPTIFHTSSAGDGRRTWGELKRELARPVNDNDDGVLATASDCLTSAVRTLNRYCWPWELVTHDFTSTANTDTYALPSAFKREMAAYIMSSGRPNNRLRYMEIADFLGEYSLNQNGQPTIYTLLNTHETGQITLWPRPEVSTYSLRIWYYRRSGTRYQDSEIPDWPEEFEEVAQQWAWYEMMKRMPGYADKLPTARSAAMQARAELVSMTQSRGDSVGV